MAQFEVKDTKGKKVGTVELDDAVFGTDGEVVAAVRADAEVLV